VRRDGADNYTREVLPTTKELPMPELLQDGLPGKSSRSKFDFTPWADGQAWKFVRGDDYESSTETFRANVKRWAKLNRYDVELRPYPAADREGREIPLVKADAVALGVRFIGNGSEADARTDGRRQPSEQAQREDRMPAHA
jgi:hypothetical protein